MGKTTGSVYLSDKNMRGDFQQSMADWNNYESHVISDGVWSYTWTSLQPQGTKLKVADLEQNETQVDDDESTNPLDLEDEVNFECKPWRADNSKFIPPNNIEFVDISTQLQQIQETTEEVENLKCAACDQLPAGEGREQCKQSLGCQ